MWLTLANDWNIACDEKEGGRDVLSVFISEF